MRISGKNLLWAAQHPIKTLRYVKFRDVIPYSEIARHLPQNPVILEAGAANGENTVEMANFWPAATIHAFEPVPAAKTLVDQKTTAMKQRVHTYPCALGDQSGVFTLHVSGSGDGNATQSSSLLKPSGHHEEYGFVVFEDTVEVEVVQLDAWAESHGVKRLDFLWLDMQGFELRALKGGTEILKSVSAIQIEVQHTELYDGAPLYPEVKAWLRQHGFVPKIEAVFRIGGNVLFTRE